jgi:hypothetical protein
MRRAAGRPSAAPARRRPQVRCTPPQRAELRNLVETFRGGIVDVSQGTVVLEVQGKDDKMRALCDLLEPYGGGPGLGLVCVCVCVGGGGAGLPAAWRWRWRWGGSNLTRHVLALRRAGQGRALRRALPAASVAGRRLSELRLPHPPARPEPTCAPRRRHSGAGAHGEDRAQPGVRRGHAVPGDDAQRPRVVEAAGG